MEPSPDKKARTFYWYFRPIAIFSMLVGVLPLQNTYHKNGSRLRFKVFSFPHIYSSIIFYSSAYCLYYYSGFVFMSDSHEIGFIWRCIALYLMTARSAICYVYCTTHAKKFTKLIKLLELFDMKKTDVLQLDENTGFKRFLAWTVGPLMFGIFFVMGGFYELSGIAEGIFNETLHYHEQVEVASKLFGLLGIWQIAPLLLYVYFTMIIKHNLVEIVRILKSNKIVCNFAVKNSNIGNADYVVNTRHMYTIITASVRKVSDIFGNFLAIDQFCLIAMFVVNIYVYFFTSNQDSHLIIYTLINAVIIGIVINLSNKLKEMGEKILDLLERYPVGAFESAAQVEIQTFLLQAAVHPIEISAAGYFIMDRTQIPSILSAVASYIIVLVQLSPQISANMNITMT